VRTQGQKSSDKAEPMACYFELGIVSLVWVWYISRYLKSSQKLRMYVIDFVAGFSHITCHEAVKQLLSGHCGSPPQKGMH
jgi:hypothetical protein